MFSGERKKFVVHLAWLVVGAALILQVASQGPSPSSRVARPYTCGFSMASDRVRVAQELERSFADWKGRYVIGSGIVGDLRVRRPEDGNDTVSEGVAYGLLLSAYLDDRETFEGLWGYARSHLSGNGLMDWRIEANNSVSGHGAATDADEDMAIALIVADKKWGGYAPSAKALIGNIMRHEVEAATYVLKPGDGWGGSNVTNPSYFAPAYYKVFATYTGDATWNLVVDRGYETLANANAQADGHPTGLLPDWSTATGQPIPGMGYDYRYDATRSPWRLAKDAGWFCDARASAQLSAFNVFFRHIGVPNIVDGYRLDGTPVGSNHVSAFIAPVTAGAIVSTDIVYRTALWEEAIRVVDHSYYNDSLRLLSLLFSGGEMPNPLTLDDNRDQFSSCTCSLDITYGAPREGWLYPAVLLDCIRAGPSVGRWPTTCASNWPSTRSRWPSGISAPSRALVHHTNHSCQYTAAAYRAGRDRLDESGGEVPRQRDG